MPEIKERNSELSPNTAQNKTEIVDIGQENISREPIPREIKTWMDKVEQASTSQPNMINDDGQVTGAVSNSQKNQAFFEENSVHHNQRRKGEAHLQKAPSLWKGGTCECYNWVSVGTWHPAKAQSAISL